MKRDESTSLVYSPSVRNYRDRMLGHLHNRSQNSTSPDRTNDSLLATLIWKHDLISRLDGRTRNRMPAWQAVSNIATVCWRACKSHPIIRISASFGPSTVG
jgi:hypothetical protein